MRAWVYKVNSRRPGREHDWHFDQYFRYRGRQRFQMGGAERIRSPSSWACLRRVRAFTVPSRGTIHAVAADELRAVLRLLIAFNPRQRQAILRFAKSRL